MTSDWGIRQNLPYLNGVYIAIDAVSDVFLVVDGPFCVIQKTELHLGHTPTTSIVSATGIGRVVHTDVRLNSAPTQNVIVERTQEIEEILARVSRLEGAELVLVTSMDFYQILNVPLERHRKAAQRAGRAPIVLLEARSLEGDWLDGYGRTLERIVTAVEIPEPSPIRGDLAIIGPMLDRTGGESLGNMAELERLIRGLGLRPVLIWPDGGPTTNLRRASTASTIVSLPYGRRAGRALAERLGIDHVEAPLPLGVGATMDFVLEIGRATGTTQAARSLVSDQASELTSRCELYAHRHLAGRIAFVQADPHAALGISALLGELGVEVEGVQVLATPQLLDQSVRTALERIGAELQPSVVNRPAAGLEIDAESDVDVLIAPTLFPHRPRRAAWIPFGYPNYLSHPIRHRPYLGFEGVLWWVERLVEACLDVDARGQSSQLRGGVAYQAES